MALEKIRPYDPYQPRLFRPNPPVKMPAGVSHLLGELAGAVQPLDDRYKVAAARLIEYGFAKLVLSGRFLSITKEGRAFHEKSGGAR